MIIFVIGTLLGLLMVAVLTLLSDKQLKSMPCWAHFIAIVVLAFGAISPWMLLK